MTYNEEEKAWDDGYNYRSPAENSLEYMQQWDDGKYVRDVEDYENFIANDLKD